MRTSFTTEENKYIEIFDNYINGNLSDFRKSVRNLSKIDLLKCIDLAIQNYGYKFQNHDILRIFLINLQFN